MVDHLQKMHENAKPMRCQVFETEQGPRQVFETIKKSFLMSHWSDNDGANLQRKGNDHWIGCDDLWIGCRSFALESSCLWIGVL
jgi:hypothetical protein